MTVSEEVEKLINQYMVEYKYLSVKDLTLLLSIKLRDRYPGYFLIAA